ncbi:Low molecular weight phosphotyrosine protein phosphatase [Acidipropionibacterium acidipropionici ATCC 4875]|uniref:protein-tyrosine-phosphatase n=1 Tax=Acidipropionibacterium acidipropionici (strain ATCC 4875 / DSM 20272 / JCM 6432 / NBRC 12425 / NCIMB 8070 / 4) TaxID=1171373 RepID=K7S8T4_ACIA4|nr:low molecular weight protein-tyrosine-phosphatase [Acidipropionibacterium acidipropionici]AFV90967.1 Low molecular weight phosphotyrosine protein phosphatase [Acidipropionibacterium acidipropionici ATCC 4875]
MTRTPSVVFVCWGNICRSPMAERVARKYLDDAGVEAVVTSAGVSDEEGPAPMDRRARAVLERAGYDASGHTAHQIDAEEIDSADLVIAAEPMHIQAMRRLSPVADNLRLISDFDPSKKPGTPLPDPWYGPDSQFVTTLRAIEAAMPGIVDAVRDLT